MNKIMEVEATMPAWLAWIIKPFCKTHFTISEALYAKIADLIQDNEFDEARRMLQFAAQKYGLSTFTTRLQTRIDRIEILGK